MKDIPGFEGLYKVTFDGFVISCKTGLPMKQSKDKGGYLITCLSKHGKKFYNRTHRIVAELYLINPNNYPEVNHKDHDRTNNNVNNLEWCTRSYNLIHRKHSREYYQMINMSKPGYVNNFIKKSKGVLVLFPDGTTREFKSRNEVQNFINIPSAMICRSIANNRECRGYKFFNINTPLETV